MLYIWNITIQEYSTSNTNNNYIYIIEYVYKYPKIKADLFHLTSIKISNINQFIV